MIDSEYSAAHAGICSARVTQYRLTRESTFIDRARLACSAALDANPNLHMVYSALGELYLSTGNHAEAEKVFRNALEINQKDVQAMRGVAEVLQRRQQFEEAERLLQRAIDLQPGNWRSIDALGAMYFYGGRYREAAEQFRRVVILDPDNWQGHGNLGGSLMMSGEFAEALDAIQHSLQLEERPSQRSNLATVYYYLGEYDRSVEIHRQTLETTPEINFVWLNLGDSLRFSSQPQHASDAYKRAAELSRKFLEINGNNPVDLMVLAWATANLGEADQARDLIDRALELASDDPYVRYYDGLLKKREGKTDEAIAALRSAVQNGYPVAMLAADPLVEQLHGIDTFERILDEGR